MTTSDVIPDVVQPGEMIDGKYLVERRLGAGGMGIVVAARHVELDQHVAIKLLYPSTISNPEVVARFSREARAAAKIRGEHAVKVIDVGRMATGAPFMVMEHLDGSDLSEIVEKGGALPIGDAVNYVLQTCVALAEAHALGIVHRDLKSANLFLTRQAEGAPCVKVLDFGISKMSPLGEDGASGLTASQSVLGSPAYMSPEQLLSSKRVDARTDIWGLGVILYELISGDLPFQAPSMVELFGTIAHGAPPKLSARVPAKLVAAIDKCLEKDPTKRFANVAALAEAIAPFAPVEARPLAQRAARLLGVAARSEATPAPSVTSSLGPENWAPIAVPTARSRLPLLVAGLALAVVVFGGILVVVAQRRGPPPTALPEAQKTAMVAPVADTAPPSPASTAAPSASVTAAATPSPSAPIVEPAAPTRAVEPPIPPAVATPVPSSAATAAPVSPRTKPAGTAPPRAPKGKGSDPFDTRE